MLKKRLWHKCFPVNFMKFLRTPFSQNTSWWLLLFLELIISISISTTLLLWRKIRTSFKILVSKKTTTWRLKKSHSNDKLWEKITSSSYHMEQKTFIEAICIYNIHTGENHFCSCSFWKFVSRLDSDRLKNLKCTLVCTSLLLLLQRRKDQINTVYVK